MESKHQAKQEVQESYAKYMKRIRNEKKNSNGNSNVCFLCGRKGHYGSQTSCYAANRYAANQIRKGGYYN
jgi:uncharacterized protein YaaW (UPF0174 family)